MTEDPTPGPLRFGPNGRYLIQPLERRLLVDGEPAALGARAFDLLLALAAQPGTLLTKHQLIDAVWPGVVVEENNLAAQISALRKVLGGDVIVTIPGRGYRFAARLESAAGQAAEAASSQPATLLGEAKLKTNLPQPLPALLGRADDLAALGALIDQHPLVSIVGAGGMGKSLLTQHLLDGRRGAYTHGVCWVELGTVTDPALLPGAVAAALGVRAGGSDALKGLCGAVAPLQVLVALDNAEQVLEGVAALAQALVRAAPRVRLVVTSQAPLRLFQEQVFRIGPLAVPETPLPAAEALGYGAVALFDERARHADAHFKLTDAATPAAIELCRALDGLPLAIELAAARVPLLGVQRLAASMQSRLKLLTANRNRLAPQRQQTLRATLEWSHGFLDERERAVFRRLAVFAGSGSLAMIQQVVADPAGEGELDEWAVLDVLMLLVDRSLVTVLNGDGMTDPRYRLLDSPRVYAWDKLRAAGEEALLRERHAQAVATAFEQASDVIDWDHVGVDGWVRSMAADIDNGRDALAWARAAGDARRYVQIAGTLGRALPGSADRELQSYLEVLEHLLDRVESPHLIRQIGRLTGGSVGTTQRQRTVALRRRCVERIRALGVGTSSRDRAALAVCLGQVSTAEARIGDLPAAEAALAEALAMWDTAWPRTWKMFVLDPEAFIAMGRGDTQALLRSTREQMAIVRTTGNSDGAALGNLVDAELAAGHTTEAAKMGAELVDALSGGRDERSLAYARINLAAALLTLGEAVAARLPLRAAWTQAGLFGVQPFVADYLVLLAALEGRHADAACLAGYADTLNAEIGPREPNEAAAIERATALAATALGEAEFARRHAAGCALGQDDIAALAFSSGAEAE